MPVREAIYTLYTKQVNFYIRGSVHRNSRLKTSNKMQLYADIYLLLNYSTCFGCPSHPLSGVHKTVVAASGTDRTIWGASFLKHDLVWSHLVCILLHLIEFLQPKQVESMVGSMVGRMICKCKLLGLNCGQGINCLL